MLTRVFCAGVAALLFAAPAAAAERPIAVVAIRSVDSLIESGKYAFEASGNSDSVAKIKTLFDQATGGAPTGIDFSRPIGLKAGFAGQPTMVAMVPITDASAVLTQIGRTPVQLKKLEEGLFEVQAPQPVFVRFAEKWAYVGNSKDEVASAPADPAPMLNEALGEYQLAYVVDFAAIPDFLRQLLTSGVKSAIEAADRNLEGRTDPRSRGERLGTKAFGDLAIAFINGLDRITLGLRIDKNAKRFVADTVLQAQKGSALAKGFADLGDGARRFQGLSRNQPFAFATVGLTLIPVVKEPLSFLVDEMLKSMKDELAKKGDDPHGPAIVKAAEDVLRGFIDSGRIDFGLSAAGAKDDVSMIVALGLTKVDSLMKLVDELATDEKAKKEVEFNVAEHRGVKMHRLRKSEADGPQNTLKHFGAVFGLSSDGLYFSAGNGDGLAPLKTAVETVQAVSPAGAAPLAELRVFAGRIDKLKTLDMKAEAQAAFAKHFDRDDRVSLTLDQVPQGLRLRLDTEEGFIRFFAEAVTTGMNKR